MGSTIIGAALLSMAVATVPCPGGEKEKKIDHETGFTAYFVKNTFPLKENTTLLAFTSKAEFDKTFGVGFTMKKPKMIDPKAFGSKMAVAVLKKGNALWTYEVQQVTAEDGVLRIEYKATEGKAGTAKFASPLIVLVSGREYRQVVFVENGKDAGKVDVKK